MIKRLLLIVLTLITAASYSYAANCGQGWCWSNCFDDNYYIKGGNVGVGYKLRKDDFDYKIEERIFSIPIETERSFDDLSINEITGYARIVTIDNFFLRATGGYGWLDCGGKTREKISIDDILNFHIEGETNEKYTADVSASIGYVFKCVEDFRLIPLVGYSWHRQHFEASSLEIVFDNQYGFDTGVCLGDLTESYKADWYGPWLGFDVELDFICDISAFGGFEFHWVEYSGKYRRDSITIYDITIDDYTRKDCGCGYGVLGYAGVTFNFCRKWYFTLMGGAQAFNVSCGLATDSDDAILEIKSLDWKSHYLSIALHYPF